MMTSSVLYNVLLLTCTLVCSIIANEHPDCDINVRGILTAVGVAWFLLASADIQKVKPEYGIKQIV